MPTKGKPNSKVKNDLGNERHYGPDGKATHDVDWGHSQRHPDLPVPHWHDWTRYGDQPHRGDAYDPDEATKIVAGAAAIYAGYLIIKWGVAALLAAHTGGGSLGVAAVTP